MTKEELIAAIRALTDYGGIKLKDIEIALNMPQNILSGMLNGTRRFTEKWQKLLLAYVEAKIKGSPSIVIPIVRSATAAINGTASDAYLHQIEPGKMREEPALSESLQRTFMGNPIPAGLKGIDLTIWKAQVRETAQQSH